MYQIADPNLLNTLQFVNTWCSVRGVGAERGGGRSPPRYKRRQGRRDRQPFASLVGSHQSFLLNIFEALQLHSGIAEC